MSDRGLKSAPGLPQYAGKCFVKGCPDNSGDVATIQLAPGIKVSIVICGTHRSQLSQTVVEDGSSGSQERYRKPTSDILCGERKISGKEVFKCRLGRGHYPKTDHTWWNAFGRKVSWRHEEVAA